VKRLTIALALAAVALVAAACGSSGATPAPTTPAASADPNAIRISADKLKFDTAELQAPAGKAFTISFENKESVPHNVAIYSDESASKKIAANDPFGGPKTETVSVPALDPGSYFFRCDVHPEMKGTLVVK
jgi:plastocyanin